MNERLGVAAVVPLVLATMASLGYASFTVNAAMATTVTAEAFDYNILRIRANGGAP